MMIRSILAPLFGHGADAATLTMAGTIAKQFGTGIEALYLGPESGGLPSGLAVDVATPTLIAELRETERAEYAAARDGFTALCERIGVPEVQTLPVRGTAAMWHRVTGPATKRVRARARYHDLTCLAATDGSEAKDVAEAVLLHAGRPLFYLSPKCPIQACVAEGKKVLVAWNASPQAARAVAGALPLLRKAAMVEVVTTKVVGGDPQAAGELTRWLERHEVPASAAALSPTEEDTDDLMWITTHRGADLLVMGAYSHSRISQLVLGGVTRDALSEAPVPVLMMH